MTGLIEKARNQSRRRKSVDRHEMRPYRRITGTMAQSTPELSLDSDIRRHIEAEPTDDGSSNGHINPPPQAFNLQEEQIRRLIQTQEETARALFKLNSAQEETARTLSELNDAIRDIPSAIAEQKAENNDDASKDDDDLGLDRKQVRLDGLEVYAVVSAVTAGTMVAVFDSYHPGDITELLHQGRFLEVLTSVIFLGTGTVGIVCGLHCIFIFSLVTMYGRTALGMDRDDALEDFFGATGLQRYHGFQTFMGSLYSLMIQLIIVIASKVSTNPFFLLIVLGVTGRMMFFVYADTQVIMEKAQVIFQPATATKHRNMMRSAESIMNLDSDPINDASSSEDSIHEEQNFRRNSMQKARKHKSSMAMSAYPYAITGKTNQFTEDTKRPTRHRSEGDVDDPSEEITKAAHSKIRWSEGDISLEEDEEEDGQDQIGKGRRSIRSDIGSILKKAKPTKSERKIERRKSRSSLSQPAIQQMIKEIDEEPAPQPRRHKNRSTLDLNIDMMDIVLEDEDDHS